MFQARLVTEAGQFNNTTYNSQKVLDLDQQVGHAFAANSETLVTATADHETGSYSTIDGGMAEG